MKASELKNSSVAELNEEVIKLLKQSFNLKLQKKLGQLNNTAQLREIRRNIARIKTVITEKAGGNNE